MPLFALFWTVTLAFVYAWALRTIAIPVLMALVPTGLGIWFLFEYLMHRKFFHHDARSPLLRRLIFLLHKNHHQDPDDPLRALMPLQVSMPLAALLVLAAWSISKGAEGVALGFVTGYVIYDGLHWACHHCRMESGVALRLKRHHLRHHHVAPGHNYAVTAIFLDHWFGTKLRRR